MTIHGPGYRKQSFRKAGHCSVCKGPNFAFERSFVPPTGQEKRRFVVFVYPSILTQAFQLFVNRLSNSSMSTSIFSPNANHFKNIAVRIEMHLEVRFEAKRFSSRFKICSGSPILELNTQSALSSSAAITMTELLSFLFWLQFFYSILDQ